MYLSTEAQLFVICSMQESVMKEVYYMKRL